MNNVSITRRRFRPGHAALAGMALFASTAAHAGFWPWDARSTPVPPPYGWLQPVPPPGFAMSERFDAAPDGDSADPYAYLGARYPEVLEEPIAHAAH